MTYRHFTINVARDGRHFFGTHERSTTSPEDLKKVYHEIRERFPESDGFSVDIIGKVEYGHGLSIGNVDDYIKKGSI
jgi:hypothetical protein